jgi:hypothetical protein
VLQTVRHLGERGIRVIVLQLGATDLTSPAGKLLLSMLATVAEMKHDFLVERTQVGRARARAEGKRLGKPSHTTPEQRAGIRRSSVRVNRSARWHERIRFQKPISSTFGQVPSRINWQDGGGIDRRRERRTKAALPARC